MRIYLGVRTETGCHVWWSEPPTRNTLSVLSSRLDLYNHSPDGLNWGYCGSGPAQLALALAAHATRDPKLAVAVHQRLKEIYVSQIETNEWVITYDRLMELISECAPASTT